MSDERTVAVIPKNGREELRISLSEYRGTRLVNLRVWYNGTTGEMKPGKDGFAIRIDLLADLADGVSRALEEARACGWLSAVAE